MKTMLFSATLLCMALLVNAAPALDRAPEADARSHSGCTMQLTAFSASTVHSAESAAPTILGSESPAVSTAHFEDSLSNVTSFPLSTIAIGFLQLADNDDGDNKDRNRKNDHKHRKDPAPTPEPATAILFGVALLIGGGILRRLRVKQH